MALRGWKEEEEEEEGAEEEEDGTRISAGVVLASAECKDV